MQPMQPQQQLQPYEAGLGRYLYSGNSEKSFIDKTLARSDIDEIKEIMKKPDLERTDLLQLLYLLAGSEIKLVNFGEFDRYLLGKYYAWIRDFVAAAENLYDVETDFVKFKTDCLKKATEGKKAGKEKVLNHTQEMLKGSKKKLLHDIKFLVDIFFYLSRSTLSLEGAAFDTITKQRYEYYYPNQSQQLSQEPKRSAFNINMGRR